MRKVRKESFLILLVTFNFSMIEFVSKMSFIETFNVLISFKSTDMRFSMASTSDAVEMVSGKDNWICLENRDRDCASSTAAFNMPNSANILLRFSMRASRRQLGQSGSAIRKD